ncbi:Asp23/Gls24 family envelope stress response protein [Lentzea sp. NPDC055074]
MTTADLAVQGNKTDPGARGSLTISEVAVERIAAHAALEVDGIGGSALRVLGVTVGSEEAERDVRVAASVTGAVVALDVRLSITYPAPVGSTTEAARAHLTRRIHEMTGLSVSKVDITVTALHCALVAARRIR